MNHINNIVFNRLRRAMPMTVLMVVLLFGMAGLHAQSINMHTHGHRDTTVSHIWLYDDGGINSPYSSSCNATYTFHTLDPTHCFRIVIRDSLYRDPGLALLEVYDGDTNSTYQLSSTRYYWYYVRNRVFYSQGNTVTISFTADDDNPAWGFEIELCEAGSPAIQNVWSEIVDSNTVILRWNETDTSLIYTVDYFYSNTTDLNSAFDDANPTIYSQQSDTNFILLTGVQADSAMIYLVYVPSNTPCPFGIYGSHCQCIYPENFHVEYDADSLRLVWNDNPNVQNWRFRGWGFDYVDTIVYDTVYKYPYNCYAGNYSWSFSVSGNCGMMDCNSAWTQASSSPCSDFFGSTLYGDGNSSNSITFAWDDYNLDTSQRIIILYRECGTPDSLNKVWDTVPSGQSAMGYPRYTITGLKPHTCYTVTFQTLCANGSTSCGRMVDYTTTMDECIDYINVYDLDHVHLTWGYYDNPDSVKHYNNYDWYESGNLYFWGSDRHQPITDTNSYDWSTYNYQTGKHLRCIPPGKVASIRLGNSGIGAEAESITYDYYVDTLVYDMMVLDYAVVMQNPNHTPANQPHFTMEILDSVGSLIDSTCCYADFYAAGDLGWNTGQDNVIWKDWTTVGIDMAPYHGQNIKIRFTTKDCAEGGHYGYAYFTIHCDQKRIYIENRCDAPDSTHLIAPLGFDYEWHRAGDTTVLSTNYDCLVPIDSNTYICRASFVGKPECYFTMQTVAIYSGVVAAMHYTVDTCRQVAMLYSDSYMEFDTNFNSYTRQVVDSVYWTLDGVHIGVGDTMRLELTENRLYQPIVHAHLSDSPCEDSLAVSINVNFVYQKRIVGDTVACYGDSVDLLSYIRPKNNPVFLWDNGSADSLRTMQIFTDTTVSVQMYYNDCVDTLTKTISVRPVYADTLWVEICTGQIYDTLGFTDSVQGRNTLYMLSSHGCDSLSTLDLTVWPTYDDTIAVTTCDDSWHNLGFNADSTGLYTLSLTSMHGCDSVSRLQLLRRTIAITGDSALCVGSPLHLSATDLTGEGGQYLWNNGMTTSDITLNASPADSIFTVTVTVNDTCIYTANRQVILYPLYDDTIIANICTGVYDSLGFTEGETGVYTLHLTTVYGCDSLSSLNLTRHPTYDDTLWVTTCDESYMEYGFNEDSTGFYTHSFTTVAGCDSIVNLSLVRYGVFIDTITEEIYRGDTYVGYGFEESETGFYEITFPDMHGCDSTYRLDLLVINLQFPNAVTPNGDGINDKFYVSGLLDGELMDYSCLWIYDRWGKLVYKKENVSDSGDYWDPAADNVPSGTYFYRFMARSLSHSIEHKGVVEVVR